MTKKLSFIVMLTITTLACFVLPVPAAGEVSQPLQIESTQAATEAATETASPTPTINPTCMVNTSALNLRACAGTHCTTQNWLHEGAVLTILARKKQWIQVKTQSGGTGWVHSKYCTGE